MKKFHVFAGERYYPLRGLGDYQGSFVSLGEAREFAAKMLKDELNEWSAVAQTLEDGSLEELY